MHLPLRAALAVLLSALAAAAQCPDWKSGFQPPGLGAPASALVRHDDGTGEKLYAGGNSFVALGLTGYHTVLAWDGVAWSAVGGGPPGSVSALLSYDDGSGAQLYAGGSFNASSGLNGVARWDGASWNPLGSGLSGPVLALAQWLDGSGPALYAAGRFTFAGGVAVNYVAKWDGASWSPLGLGLHHDGYSLAVFDDGTGSALYVGGDFGGAGTIAAPRIARWDGSAWSSLALGLNHVVNDMLVWDDGTGPALYCGGWFTAANGSITAKGVAKWDGTSWSALSGNLASGDPRVETLSVYDDGTGSGAQLYAGGQFAGGIARHSAAGWSTVGTGLGQVYALAAFDDGSGRALYGGGSFVGAGTVHTEGIARWDGAAWNAVSSGMGLSSYGIYALQTFDDGTGEALFAGGGIQWAGASSVSNIARWDGSAWSPAGGGVDGTVYAFAVFDDGSGPALYAGGSFSHAGGVPANSIARWNGTAWAPLPAQIGGYASERSVAALAVFDDGTGPALYAGGYFASAGGVLVSNIARWNGATWATLGTGTNDLVRSLAVFDDGNGPALYAGGEFSVAGGGTAFRIARWNGLSWSALGTGIASYYQPYVAALRVFDDGSGPALYAAGSFESAGSAPANGIARWNGTSWSALGAGLVYDVFSLAVFDDGTGNGPALYAGGQLYPQCVTRWDGATWTQLGAGISGYPAGVAALAAFDDGTGHGPDLYAGGFFHFAGGRPSNGIAAWTGCGETGRLYCFGDGSGTACPCGNASAVGDRDGCVNSTGAGGRLRASGRPSLAHDTLVLAGTQMTNGSALYFQGTSRVNGGAGATFGDGLRCAGGTVVRLAIVPNTAGASQFPRAIDPAVSVKGSVTAPGRRVYQVWFRDAQPYCTPGTFDLTNAIEIDWGT